MLDCTSFLLLRQSRPEEHQGLVLALRPLPFQSPLFSSTRTILSDFLSEEKPFQPDTPLLLWSRFLYYLSVRDRAIRPLRCAASTMKNVAD